ncbi:Cyclin-A1-3 [Acorus calamus]|uniref:Cyclin-A1-3 n=1 Tax=Acorus calamus TaxID=4465 RepID=A0AAV9F9Q7_ACOCL|nr:Cyclin-A1-3 [Acorus calamus]
MSGMNRRSSISASSSSTAAATKRPATESVKTAAVPAKHAKKRVALGNVTNQSVGGSRYPTRSSAAKQKQVLPASTISKSKKGPISQARDAALNRKSSVGSSTLTPVVAVSCKDTSLPKNDGPTSNSITRLGPVSCSTKMSPCKSDGLSVSIDETMSTCDSIKSPDVEYIDSGDAALLASLARKTQQNLQITENKDATDNLCKRDIFAGMETSDPIIDVDENCDDPQLCATIVCDIYEFLREKEIKKRPATDFMELVQKDISPSMRAILIDWLVEVAEEYRLVPDTLYLTVNYIDRYLSGNEMNRHRLQLLGVACMLIAAKHEEICAPQVEEFCYITDNTYFKDEVLQMEASVLRYLRFEMSSTTTKCFLRRFVRVAQESDEVQALQLEFLANYIAELSLLEYSFLRFFPSIIAASAIFLAKFILLPSQRPWNATLGHYTLYKPSELWECVKELHRLFLNCPTNSLPAIREKYSQHKYKFVAKKYCPPSLPSEFFDDK